MPTRTCSQLSDGDLTRRLHTRVADDCVALADLLALIGEFDDRRLYAPAGFPSMYAYCTGRLHLSESSASKRIWAARAARTFPAVLDAIASGRVHLGAVCLMATHFTGENVAELLGAATHKTRGEVELLLARRFPRADVATSIRKLPVKSGPAASAEMHSLLEYSPGNAANSSSPENPACEHSPAHVTQAPPAIEQPPQHSPGNARPALPPARVAPLAPERYLLKLTMGQATRDKLRRAQELLSHRVPSGDVVEVFDRALDALLARLEKEKFAATERPGASRASASDSESRRIPAAVKRAVRQRDGDRCRYISEDGTRCESRRFLEWDHVVPVAKGGESTVTNLRLRCRTHNQHEADLAFGAGFMRAQRQASRSPAAVN